MAGDTFSGGGGPKAGQTSVTIPIRLIKNDGTGGGVTGKLATNLTGSYWRQGGTRTAITLSDLAAVNSAYSSGGVKEVDATNMPGLYRLDVPDAAFATGVPWVILAVVCTGAIDYEVFVPLESVGAAENYARIGAPVGASIAADLAEIEGETDGITAIPTNPLLTNDARLDHLDANISSRSTFAGGAVASVTGDVSVGTNKDKTGYSLSVAGILAIWNQLTTDVGIITGSFAKFLKDNLNAAITSRAAPADRMDLVNSVNPTALAEISGAVWGDTTAYGTGTKGAELAALPTAAQIDTQLSGTHGSGPWGPIGSTGQYTITYTVKDAISNNPLQGVLVTIKDGTDTTTLDQERTGTNGQKQVSLDTGTYYVHIGSVPGYSSLVATLTVTGNGSVTYALQPIQPTAPIAPGMCTVYGYIYLNGVPADGVEVGAFLTDPLSYTASVLLEKQIDKAQTDVNGRFELQLVQAAQFTKGTGKYKFVCNQAGINAEIVVPTATSADIRTLL